MVLFLNHHRTNRMIEEEEEIDFDEVDKQPEVMTQQNWIDQNIDNLEDDPEATGVLDTNSEVFKNYMNYVNRKRK